MDKIEKQMSESGKGIDMEMEHSSTLSTSGNEELLKKEWEKLSKSITSKKFLGEQYRILEELKKYVNKETGQLKKEIKKIEIGERAIKNELEKKIDSSRLKMIETLGIFVALFTFISIEFQVFRSYESAQAIAGLTLIILGALTFFVIILDLVLNVNLDFLKIKHKNGLSDPLSGIKKKLVEGGEYIDFYWWKPKTWGLAVRIKFIPLISLSLGCIFCGGLLFTLAPPVNNLIRVEKQIVLLETDIEDIKDGTTILEGTYKNDNANKKRNKEILESKIDKLEYIINCLKIKGYFSNQCFE